MVYDGGAPGWAPRCLGFTTLPNTKGLGLTSENTHTLGY